MADQQFVNELNAVRGASAAWGYFVGYLKALLPDLETHIQEWATNIHIPKEQISEKFYIIIPMNGECPENFTRFDRNITPSIPMDDKETEKSTGDVYRKVTKTMHQLQHNSKTYFFCGECAGPIKTLHGIFHQVDQEQHPNMQQRLLEEVDNFVTVLDKLSLYQQTKQFAKKIVIIRYNGQNLSELLEQEVENDLRQRKLLK